MSAAPPGLPGPTDLSALSAWAPELAKTFVTLASDIALVIDAAGVIREVAQGAQGGQIGQAEAMAADDPNAHPHAGLITPVPHEWVGKAWVDTVCPDTRAKIQHLLNEVSATGSARRREVNHLSDAGSSIPVAYTAIQLGVGGPVLAVGRDLRAIAAIQQRFVQSQQSMERGYWQARQGEARHRLLFQVATDAVLVVDAQTLQVIEANHAAAKLFGTGLDQIQGHHASAGFEHHSRAPVNALLARARTSGMGGEIRARLQGTTSTASIAATPFRAGNEMRLMLRVRSVDTLAATGMLGKTLARLVDDTVDGLVVTDSSGRVLVANPAFLALVQLPNENAAKGQPLMAWLGSAGVPLAALLPRVRRDGIARRVESWIRPVGAPATRVEISAALLTEGDQECIGFTIHPAMHPDMHPDMHPAMHPAMRPATHPATEGSASRGPNDAPARAALAEAWRRGIERLGVELGIQDLPTLLHEAGALAERHIVGDALDRTAGGAERSQQPNQGASPTDEVAPGAAS